MNLDEIRELIKLAAETKVAELEVQRGDDRVRIRLSLPTELYNSAPIYHPVSMAASEPGSAPPLLAARRGAAPRSPAPATNRPVRRATEPSW